MIERVYRQVEKCGKFTPTQIIVATDDTRIESLVKSFGGNAVMTSIHHRSGTERIWEVLKHRDFDAVINIQGDEPAVPIQLIATIHDELDTGKYGVVTPAHFSHSYENYLSKNVVKVVLTRDSRALYFSRSPLPFMEKTDFNGFHHHIGIYGYLKSSLEQFFTLPPSPLEGTEKLEQLRFLENNIGIKVVISQTPSLGVDTPEDVAVVEKMLELAATGNHHNGG